MATLDTCVKLQLLWVCVCVCKICPPLGLHLMMQRCESHESEVQRSPSLDSAESEFTRAARRGHRLAVGAFYGSRGSNVKDQTAQSDGAVVAVPPGGKPQDKRVSAGGKYVVFYMDLSFVLLLEFEKLKMARGCLCCVKYMMFLFNLLFWVSIKDELSTLTCIFLSKFNVQRLL